MEDRSSPPEQYEYGGSVEVIEQGAEVKPYVVPKGWDPDPVNFQALGVNGKVGWVCVTWRRKKA